MQPEFMAGGEFGGDADEALAEILDGDAGEMLMHDFGELRVADQAGGAEAEIEQGEHAPASERAGEFLQRCELACHVAAADKRTYGRAGDDVGVDACARKRFQDADMRPAARHAGAQCDADFRTGHADLLHW